MSKRPPEDNQEKEEELKMKPTKTLLGIGNPLLDISVNIDQSFLDKYNKLPGNAVLAEEKDFPIYDEIQAKSDVLYIAGGATQNSIRGAQWMSPVKGVTHYIGSVGDDNDASKLKAAASSDGVETHYYVSKKIVLEDVQY